MKKKSKILGLMILSTALLFASCAQDGFEDESFSSTVKNSQLASPKSEEISVGKSADGSLWIITWPLVKGAEGFLCNVTNVTDPDAVIEMVKDSLIDGCTLQLPRSEDSNYVLDIRTIANKQLGNKDAETATELKFSSFTPSWAEIPAGADIAEWLAANPLPEESADELCIDLQAGAEYTLKANADFKACLATLRCTTPTKPATIKVQGEASFVIDEGFSIKNINIDATEGTNDLIVGNTTPKEVNISPSNNYYRIENPIYISNVQVKGLKRRFIYDNKVKYCFKTVIIDNCVFETCPAEAIQFIQMPTGFINDLKITNSTLWNSGTVNQNYAVQYNNSGRCDRAGYTSNSITVSNCTFYNMAKTGQWGNYSSFGGRKTSYFTMSYNIMVDCSSGATPRRFTSGSNNNANKSFVNNTWFYNGADEEPGESWDPTQQQVLGDPMFADPANGDFHYSGAAQKALNMGDPRWL